MTHSLVPGEGNEETPCLSSRRYADLFRLKGGADAAGSEGRAARPCKMDF